MLSATCQNSLAAEFELPSVTVIIPARNEELALGHVLREIPQVGHLLVVDNGSTDRTAEVARERGCNVIYEGCRGYGAACLAGLAEVERQVTAGNWAEPRVIVFLDGDFSDSPQMLTTLVGPILLERADFVLGSRLLGVREPGAMPLQSLLGNRLACTLIRWRWGVTYSDLGPFRAIRFDALRSLGMQDRNFGWTIEMQIKAAVAGLRIVEIPTPYRCRIGKSKISGTWSGAVSAGCKILFTLAKYGLCKGSQSPLGTGLGV